MPEGFALSGRGLSAIGLTAVLFRIPIELEIPREKDFGRVAPRGTYVTVSEKNHRWRCAKGLKANPRFFTKNMNNA